MEAVRCEGLQPEGASGRTVPVTIKDNAALLLLNNLEIGGSERKIVRIANALRQGGHDIHLAYLNAPHTLRGRLDPGLPVFHLDRTGKFSFPALGQLKRYILQQQIS